MATAMQTGRRGLLAAIGGNEDRDHERRVLRALVEGVRTSVGRPRPEVVVLSAASGEPDVLWAHYAPAFDALGAAPRWLDLRDRAAAEAEHALLALTGADLVFMTGGDQHRLMEVLADTPLHAALRSRHRSDRLAVAGTSAGASALGSRMPSGDEGDQMLSASPRPAPLGLDLWPGVLIDQHFAQRRRHARLIQVLQAHADLVGLGLDEDTALIARPDGALEVVGSGAVSLLDGVHQPPRRHEGAVAGVLSWPGLDCHVLAAGTVLREPDVSHRPELAALQRMIRACDLPHRH